jgi:hypothetical protein
MTKTKGDEEGKVHVKIMYLAKNNKTKFSQ